MPMPAQFTRIRGSPSFSATSATAASPFSALETVATHGDAADLGRDLLGALHADVEDRDLRALGSQRAGGGLTEARAAAGDDGDNAGWVHEGSSLGCVLPRMLTGGGKEARRGER